MRRIRRSQRRSSSSVSSVGSVSRRSASGSGSNGWSSTDAAARSRYARGPSARHWASSASVSVREGLAGRPFAITSATARGCPPVASWRSGMPSGASSAAVSGSSRTIVSGARPPEVVFARRGRAAARLSRARRRARRRGVAGTRAPPACSGPPTGDRRARARAARARRRPRRALRAPRPRRTSPSGVGGRELREGSGRAPAARSDVEREAVERLPERGGDRHVGQVLLELGAARSPDSNAVEPPGRARRAVATFRGRPRPRRG